MMERGVMLVDFLGAECWRVSKLAQGRRKGGFRAFVGEGEKFRRRCIGWGMAVGGERWLAVIG